MRSGPIAVGALLGAIAGAALAAYLQELWASEPAGEDEAELLRRLDKLEAEIEELESQRRERRRKMESAPSAREASAIAHARPVMDHARIVSGNIPLSR